MEREAEKGKAIVAAVEGVEKNKGPSVSGPNTFMDTLRARIFRLHYLQFSRSIQSRFYFKMPRSKSDSIDVGWRFCTKISNDGKTVQCNYCSKVINGGITRLKEHLAHKRGNVAPCEKVSAEVKKEMNNLLHEYKNKKKDKQRRELEVEEHITRGINRDDTDDEDSELEIAMQQSRMQEQFERDQQIMRRSSNYDVGGGSQAPRMMRSFTTKEGGQKKGRGYEPVSTPASRLRAIEVELDKDARAKKQSKLGTSWLKKQKAKVMRAFGNWFIDTNTPFAAVNSAYTNPLMNAIREAGPNVRAPSSYQLAEVYLPEECQQMKNYIASFDKNWNERGVTIMSDGWTGPTRMHIMNFLVYSNRGTVFHKSVDATDVSSKNADYYFSLMKKVVEEVGPSRVIQIVTDNEAAMKAAGKKLMEEYPHLYWTACAAHCIDLILEDIAKKTTIKEVIQQAKMITSFIYNSNWVINYMKKYTGGRELLRPGITRFATNFVSLESIIKYKTALRDMFESETWLSSKWGHTSEKNAPAVRELVLASTEDGVKFWAKANDILKIMEPLLRVLRLVDGDQKPTMGFIYEAMERAKLAIKNDCRYYKTYWKIIDNRWNFQLHHDLHAAGYFLNPQFCYANEKIIDDKEVMSGVKKVIQRIEPNIENGIKALNQLFLYKDKMDSFGSDMAQKAITAMNPAEWWETFGESAPELQHIAIRVLSQTTSSSNCERNWSMWSQVHTKARNRLQYKRLHMIVYLRYNMKLKVRHATRRSEEEIHAGFNPINLDYIFEDDPLNEWLEEREQPVFAGDDLEWMNFNDDNEANIIQIDDDEVILPEFGTSPPFQYNANQVNQRSTTHGTQSTSALDPPSDDDDDDDDGGNRQDDMLPYGYTHSSSSVPVQPHDYQPRGNYNVSLEPRHEMPTHTFSRRPRQNEEPLDNVWDDYSSHSSNNVGSDNILQATPNWGTPPHSYNEQPHLSWQNAWQWNQPNAPNVSDEHDGSYKDHIQIINHGTINYGPVHYDSSTNYGFQPYGSSGQEYMGSYLFGEHANNDHENYEPPRHSFWW